jgi:hypothetical protein
MPDADHADDGDSTDGRTHGFVAGATDPSETRATPLTACERGAESRPDADEADVSVDVDGSLGVPLRALLLPVGVGLAALQTPLAVSLLGLALVVVGGVALSQATPEAGL